MTILDQEIVRLYHDEENTIRETAKLVGCGQTSVIQSLIKSGRPPRNYGDARRLASKKKAAVSIAALGDPAYEARLGISEQTGCRLCGILVKFPMRLHLKSHHPHVTAEQYIGQFPGVRMTSFRNAHAEIMRDAAKGLRESRTLEDFMREFAESYVTPGELEKIRANQSLAALKDRVVCLMCGFKTKSLRVHVSAIHKIAIRGYRGRFPDAPTSSMDERENNRKKWSVAFGKSPEPKATRGQPAKRRAIFIEAKKLNDGGKNWPTCAEILLPEEVKKDGRKDVGERLRKGVASLKVAKATRK